MRPGAERELAYQLHEAQELNIGYEAAVDGYRGALCQLQADRDELRERCRARYEMSAAVAQLLDLPRAIEEHAGAYLTELEARIRKAKVIEQLMIADHPAAFILERVELALTWAREPLPYTEDPRPPFASISGA